MQDREAIPVKGHKEKISKKRDKRYFSLHGYGYFRLFSIYSTDDYKSFYIAAENPVSVQKIFIITCVCVLLAGCGGKDLAAYNPMGLSGKLKPEAETAFARAHVLWDQRDICSDPALAVELLDKVISLEPLYAAAYLRRGLARSDMKDWDGSFDDLSKAIRLTPSPEAFAFRGLVSMRGGNYIGARKDFDRSLQITERQHRAWNFRGALNRLEGRQDAACDDFDKGCDYGDCVGLETSIKLGECLP